MVKILRKYHHPMHLKPLTTSVTKRPPSICAETITSFTAKATRQPLAGKKDREVNDMGLFTLFILICFTIPFALTQGKPSAYEVLQEYNFPVGILPKGVTSYELDRETGEFSAYMNKTCSFSIDSYELEYKSTITGVISKDRLKNLKGVKVKVVLVWLSIVEVVRDGDGLEFSVGIASADFSINNFGECPQCGCGFDCNGFQFSSS